MLLPSKTNNSSNLALLVPLFQQSRWYFFVFWTGFHNFHRHPASSYFCLESVSARHRQRHFPHRDPLVCFTTLCTMPAPLPFVSPLQSHVARACFSLSHVIVDSVIDKYGHRQLHGEQAHKSSLRLSCRKVFCKVHQSILSTAPLHLCNKICESLTLAKQ